MNTPTQTQLLFERLSPRIGQALQLLPPTLWAQVQEVRLLQDKPIMLTINGRCRTLDSICPAVRSTPVSLQEIEQEHLLYALLTQEDGLILINAGPNILRFVPPLVITAGEVDEMAKILDRCLAKEA